MRPGTNIPRFWVCSLYPSKPTCSFCPYVLSGHVVDPGARPNEEKNVFGHSSVADECNLGHFVSIYGHWTKKLYQNKTHDSSNWNPFPKRERRDNPFLFIEIPWCGDEEGSIKEMPASMWANFFRRSIVTYEETVTCTTVKPHLSIISTVEVK